MPNLQASIDPHEQKRIKDWLKAHGHKKGKVDGLKIETRKELRKAVFELHGIG